MFVSRNKQRWDLDGTSLPLSLGVCAAVDPSSLCHSPVNSENQSGAKSDVCLLPFKDPTPSDMLVHSWLWFLVYIGNADVPNEF